MRWRAVIEYFDGSIETIHFDEFSELGDDLEAGRDWNEIKTITVNYMRKEVE